MNGFTLNILLVPFIALVLVIVWYVYSIKKVKQKSTFKRFILSLIILSFIMNLTWELLQVPLYKNMLFRNHTLLCALASLADVIMVLLIYFGLAIIYKDPLWIKNLSISRIFIAMMVGGIGAILSETRHIAAGNWAYAEAMPLLPIVNIGLSPVLQFTILPILIYHLSIFFLKFLD